MKRKLLSLLVLLMTAATGAWADNSGTCGTSLTWSYVESTHTLTISGTGAMTDYSYGETPWYGYTSDITNIVIEDGVTTIGEEAFSYCDGLTTVTIPNNVTSIGYMAFYGCHSLETVTIGSGVTSIGESAFESCNSLTDITVSGENLYYKSVDNVLFNKDGTLLIKYPEGSTATSYTIPNDVETIGDRAFISSNLTEVIIPDGVETIGDFAFTNCPVTELTIPNSVTTIGKYAFYNCKYLTTLNIGSGVTSIGDGTCDECTSLTEITVSGGTHFKSVDNVLFSYDGKTLVQYPVGSTATSYTIPDGVETIGNSAFVFSNLTEVIIPDGVETIGNCAFSYCLGLTTMNIPSSVTTIDDAFYFCVNLATVTLNSNPYIGYYTFDIDGNGTTPAVTMNLTANAAGGAYWMTFYNDNYSFEADPNTQVFKAELSGTTITLHEVTDKIVDARTAVVLKSTGDPVMTLTTSASSDSQANSLEGVDNPEGLETNGTFYVLNYKAATGVGFYKLADGKKLGYGKAYLSYDSSSAPELDYLEFNYGNGNTTGVNEVRGQKEESRSQYYDLQGRRVAQPAKGLYIVNGKKVVIK